MPAKANELPWSAVNPGRHIAQPMNFCAAVYDLTDVEHREKYNELMNLTRNVVGGDHKAGSVEIKHYDGKWVADGRYFVMVQYFCAGNASRFVPEDGIKPVRVKSMPMDLDG